MDPDPVLARRAHMEKLAARGQHAGYALLVVAVGAFVAGAAGRFTSTITTVVTLALLGSTLALAPAIVLGYAVKAAAREDRERGR